MMLYFFLVCLGLMISLGCVGYREGDVAVLGGGLAVRIGRGGNVLGLGVGGLWIEGLALGSWNIGV